jgi:threonyl-tRNA synthetase
MPDTKTTGPLLILGCPEVPVQQALALYCAHRFREHGEDLRIAGNKAVLQLLRISDLKRVYAKKMMDLDRCIEDLAEKKLEPSVCLVFAHSDAGITYATTIRYLTEGRLVAVVFGREAETLGAELDIPCEKIVEKAVHNPGQLRRRIDEVMGWAASKT